MHGWMEVWRGLTGSKFGRMNFLGGQTGALFDCSNFLGGQTGVLFDWSSPWAVGPGQCAVDRIGEGFDQGSVRWGELGKGKAGLRRFTVEIVTRAGRATSQASALWFRIRCCSN